MRSDYALYVIAIVCFIIAMYAIATAVTDLYIYTLAVIGIVFLGLGYLARPKAANLPPSSKPQTLAEPKQGKKPETEPARKSKPEKTAKRATRTRGKKKSTTKRKKKT